MTESRLRRILEMLNFYSDTFARVSLINLQEVGETAVTLVCSILNCSLSAVLIEDPQKQPSLLASSGLNPESIPLWQKGNRFFEHLWRSVDSGTLVTVASLDPETAQAALRMGVGDVLLVAPLKTVEDSRERHLGYILAAQLRDPSHFGEDRLALEVIAGHLTGALVACKANRLLTTINESLLSMIQERELAQEALRQSEAKFARVFHSSPDSMAITTMDSGHILEVNSGFEEVTGFTRKEAMGKTTLDLGMWERPLQRPEIMKRIASEGQVRNLEIGIRKKTGEIAVGLFSGQRFPFEGKDCVVSVVRDVTEHKKLEEQVRQSGKYEAIGRLAGGIAHDFNNMLEVVLGQSDLLLKGGPTDETTTRRLREIQEAADQAAELTQKLLAFSRRQVLQPEPVNLNDLVRELEPSMRRLLGKQSELFFSLENGLHPVFADPGQLTHAILALAHNAHEAMPEGGRVYVTTANIEISNAAISSHGGDERPGSYVLFSMKDSGRGIDDSARPVLFEPFYSTKSSDRGAGLGLAAVHGIVGQSGGFIDVESAPGRGATFRIFLPRLAHTGSSPSQQRMSSADAALSGIILLAEDEDRVRGIVTEILSQNGFEVLAASDGEEALQMAEHCQGKIDLLCADLVMPGMSGGELASQLQSLFPAIKVLFMSGYTPEAIAEQGISRPSGEFLQKPFRPAALLEKIKGLLRAGEGKADAVSG
ncbi:MAG: response regulator [Acidobacteria bacterium]|nr:response regulator [Acidobacteriota bacterium]